ncbi:hypothetical protein AB0H88_48200 [Nonomuraea sp. NPDC050680]|uniref:hypothetical protein n=1 Tax=Nonomuraea sp. NPDC050680 TaxID=3154630 RepID=UPI0033CA5F00
MKRILLVTATAALALAATACGTEPSSTGVASVKAASSTAPTATASPTAGVDPQEQARKFAACMRENGVDMPDPDPDGGGGLAAMTSIKGDKDKIQKALEACRSLSPIKNRAELKPEDTEQLRQFAACMRENGVDMPDPDASGKILGKGMARNFKPDDPAFKKAYEACRGKFPKMGQAR